MRFHPRQVDLGTKRGHHLDRIFDIAQGSAHQRDHNRNTDHIECKQWIEPMTIGRLRVASLEINEARAYYNEQADDPKQDAEGQGQAGRDFSRVEVVGHEDRAAVVAVGQHPSVQHHQREREVEHGMLNTPRLIRAEEIVHMKYIKPAFHKSANAHANRERIFCASPGVN